MFPPSEPVRGKNAASGHNRAMPRWVEAGLIALAVGCAVVPVAPPVVERWFSTGLYPPIQRVLTPLTNLVPFAIFDLMTVGAAIALVVTLIRAGRRARAERRWMPLLGAVRTLAATAAIAYLAFAFLWGFNYRRLPMAERLVLTAGAPTPEAVESLGLEAVARLNALYTAAHAQGWAGDPTADGRLTAQFATVQGLLADAPRAVPGRLKRSIYGPYFRWTSVDGMVNPFALEVLSNPDLLPFERPMVAAHEWAHLAGYAHEAEANFVGFLTCVRGDAAAQYSGWLYLYWQIGGEVTAVVRQRMADGLESGPRRDLDAIVERLRRGQLPLLRNASWLVYDQYLRANRVDEGVRSYGAVVTLILRATFEDGWTPVRRHAPGSSR